MIDKNNIEGIESNFMQTIKNNHGYDIQVCIFDNEINVICKKKEANAIKLLLSKVKNIKLKEFLECWGENESLLSFEY